VWDLFLRFPTVAVAMGALLGVAAWWWFGTPPQRGGFWAALRDAIWPVAVGMVLGASLWVLLSAPPLPQKAPSHPAGQRAALACKRCF